MKKSILYLTTRPISPPWSEASKNIAYELARKINNFDIIVLTRNNTSKTIDLADSVQQAPVYGNEKFSFSTAIKVFLLLIRKGDIGLIHQISNPSLFKSRLIKFFTKTRKIKVIKTLPTMKVLDGEPKKLRKALDADIVITYSKFSDRKLKNIGVKNTRMIYPGINLNKYSPRKISRKTMKSYGLKQGDFVITFPGEYLRLGSIDAIYEAVLNLSANHKISSFKFIFACRIRSNDDQIKKTQLISLFESRGVMSSVVFIDLVDDMPSLFNASDLIIYPVEKMIAGKFVIPLVILEAMACGKPVIVSSIPEFSELKNGNNLMIVPTGDAEALTNMIEHCYLNPESRVKTGASAQAYIRSFFDSEKIIPEYKKLYSDLLGSENA